MTNAKIILPKVVFESGWLLDDSIAEISGFPLDDNAVSEISERLPEFQRYWDTLGLQLLAPIVGKFGLNFEEQDIKGFLLCGKLHSQSHPLIVNVKYYLASVQKEPHSMEEFVEVVFHELLHILLQDRLSSWPTPSIEKYQNEDFEVQSHLHLMSLQKFAHAELGRDTSPLKEWYGRIGPNYSHAWNLISEQSNQKRFLDEIPKYFNKCTMSN